MRKTVPDILHKDRGQRPRSVHRPRAQFFSIWTSWPVNNIFIFFFINFIFTETFIGFFVPNLLLSAGGQDGKIPPAHETNQITGFFLSCLLAHPNKINYIILLNILLLLFWFQKAVIMKHLSQHLILVAIVSAMIVGKFALKPKLWREDHL